MSLHCLRSCILAFAPLTNEQEFAKTTNKKDTHSPKHGVLEGKASDADYR